MSIFDQRAGTPGYESDGWQTPSLRASADRATARRQVEDQIRIQRTAQKNAKRALRKGDAQAWQFWHNAAGGRTTGINDSQQIRREAGATARIQNERADRMAQESQRIEEQALARLNRGVAPMEPSPMENRATESEFLNRDDFLAQLRRSDAIRNDAQGVNGGLSAHEIAIEKSKEFDIPRDYIQDELDLINLFADRDDNSEVISDVEGEIAQSRTRDGKYDELVNVFKAGQADNQRISENLSNQEVSDARSEVLVTSDLDEHVGKINQFERNRNLFLFERGRLQQFLSDNHQYIFAKEFIEKHLQQDILDVSRDDIKKFIKRLEAENTWTYQRHYPEDERKRNIQENERSIDSLKFLLGDYNNISLIEESFKDLKQRVSNSRTTARTALSNLQNMNMTSDQKNRLIESNRISSEILANIH